MKNAALRMISIRVKNHLSHKIFLSKPGPIIDFAMSSQFKLVVLMSMLMLNVTVDADIDFDADGNGDVVSNADANAVADNDNDIAVHSFDFNLVSAYLLGSIPPLTIFIN